MKPDLPVFRIGETNLLVQPGDRVWTDLVVAESTDPQMMPVVRNVPAHGVVRFDGTVLLMTGKIVELRACRICEKVIRV